MTGIDAWQTGGGASMSFIDRLIEDATILMAMPGGTQAERDALDEQIGVVVRIWRTCNDNGIAFEGDLFIERGVLTRMCRAVSRRIKARKGITNA
jgi:hypothetical protein